MKENYNKEIDALDLLYDWLSHWRSFLVVMLIGIIISGLYTIRFNSNPYEDESGSELRVTTEYLEKNSLSEKEIIEVDELIDLYNNYLDNIKLYNKNKDSLEIHERVEVLDNIANTKTIIEEQKLQLADVQLSYFYGKLDIDTVVDVVDGRQVSGTEISLISWGRVVKRIVLTIILLLIVHLLFFALKYLFDKKIKHSDSISNMVDIPVYSLMVDWEKLDKKCGLDRFINKMRYASLQKTSISETLKINGLAVVDMLNNRGYSSIAVVGPGLDAEREAFSDQISKTNPDVIVKSIDSITHSFSGAKDISGVKAAVLVVKVGFTSYQDFFEEVQSLIDRDIDVLGIAVFE